MRTPRFRPSVGRLIALVAVSALILGAIILGGRADHCRRQARLWEMTAELRGAEIDLVRIELASSGPMPGLADRLAQLSEERATAELKARQYRDAQRRPWLRLPEDLD